MNPTPEIKVSVVSQFLLEHSAPQDGRYAFSYTITIRNQGTVPAQLIRMRSWPIAARDLAKPASTGRASKPMVEIRIAGDDGSDKAPFEEGEICIRTAANVRGYWRRPKETAEAFKPDGWFMTGDVGYLDEDGYLFIVDRKKDIIIRGGENISCQEVEAAIYAHPAVLAASVFGLPDERLGEIVGAVAYLKPGEKAEPEAIVDFARQSLAAFKVPARLWISADPLPRLGSEKVDKVSLRKTYREIFLNQRHAAT